MTAAAMPTATSADPVALIARQPIKAGGRWHAPGDRLVMRADHAAPLLAGGQAVREDAAAAQPSAPAAAAVPAAPAAATAPTAATNAQATPQAAQPTTPAPRRAAAPRKAAPSAAGTTTTKAAR